MSTHMLTGGENSFDEQEYPYHSYLHGKGWLSIFCTWALAGSSKMIWGS